MEGQFLGFVFRNVHIILPKGCASWLFLLVAFLATPLCTGFSQILLLPGAVLRMAGSSKEDWGGLLGSSRTKKRSEEQGENKAELWVKNFQRGGVVIFSVSYLLQQPRAIVMFHLGQCGPQRCSVSCDAGKQLPWDVGQLFIIFNFSLSPFAISMLYGPSQNFMVRTISPKFLYCWVHLSSFC